MNHKYISVVYMLTQFITSIIRVQSGQIIFFTVYFHFTEVTVSIRRIPIRKRFVSSVVVVDDVSPVVWTGYVYRIRYCGSRVVGVPKTQHSVLFVCCVGDVDGEAEEPPGITVVYV